MPAGRFAGWLALLSVSAWAQRPIAGVPAEVTFRPAENLSLVGTSAMLVTSGGRDVRIAKRVTIEAQADGTLRLRHTFPKPGRYVVYAGFRGEGGEKHVVPYSIEVAE